MNKRKFLVLIGDVLGCLLAFLFFIIPFYFMFVNSIKDNREANQLNLAWPAKVLWQNYLEVLQVYNYQILTAFKNSISLTIIAVILLVAVCSMAGYVLQRRKDRLCRNVNALFMTGLMIPAAILPTIWLLQRLQIYRTLLGMALVEVALQIPFTIMLYRGYIGSIPHELEEAGYIDGCSPLKIYQAIIFPLLKPITSTVIILNAVTVFNDFTNPLYFWPGTDNITIQLTLFNYKGLFSREYHLLFANVFLITLPMIILFLYFNKRIVDGIVAGSVKG